jgi:hypothetical protein
MLQIAGYKLKEKHVAENMKPETWNLKQFKRGYKLQVDRFKNRKRSLDNSRVFWR